MIWRAEFCKRGKGAARYGSTVEARIGRAEFLGTAKTDATDREQRDDGRRAYEENIRRSTIQAGPAVKYPTIHNSSWSRRLANCS
jgi:hypothetical protein